MTSKIVEYLATLRMKFAHASGLFTMFGMPMLIANLIQEKLSLMGISISFWVLVVFGLIGITALGIILDKLGWLEAEQTYLGRRNKKLMELHKK